MNEVAPGGSDSGDGSAAMGNSSNSNSATGKPRILSLTRALNNASNRAVRRILLSRSWPSAEALNLSLRQVLLDSKSSSSVDDGIEKGEDGEDEIDQKVDIQNEIDADADADADAATTAKCPVPRPILNIIVRQQEQQNNADNDNNESEITPITKSEMSTSSSTQNPLSKMKLTDEEWVTEQMRAFRETYGLLPGYEYADAYMQCILSLATSGVESERVDDVSYFTHSDQIAAVVVDLFCAHCVHLITFIYIVLLANTRVGHCRRSL